MKIAYFISTRGHGRGGHFYDLNVIVKHLKVNNSVKVFNIGINPSPVVDELKEHEVEVDNVKFNGKNYLSVRKHIRKSIKKEAFNAIHCFDSETFFIVKGAFPVSKKKILLSKCGGPNPANNNYPKTSNLHVMSQENLRWFKENKMYKDTQIFLLPNRAEKVTSDSETINELQKRFNNKTTFLRISRITNHYRTSFEQTIELANKLKKENKALQFVIIGVVQDNNLLSHLEGLVKNKSTVFITDDKYTVNASRLIDAFDFIIGTGRGVMEASSLGKVLLTPIKQGKFPAIVEEENFQKLFSTNFSPRNSIPDFSEENNLNKIRQALNDENYLNKLKAFSQKAFKDNFFIESAINDYQNIYDSLIAKNPLFLWNLIRGLASTVLTFNRVK